MALAAPTIMTGGVIHTGTSPAARIQPQVSPKVALYDADIWPMTHLTRSIASEVVNGYEYTWYDNQYVPQWDIVAIGCVIAAVGSANTVVVTNKYYAVYDVLHFPATGSYLRVTAVAGDGITLTATTIYGAGQTIATLAEVVKLSEAYPEGSTAGEPMVTQLEPRNNYTIIVRKSVEQTGTMKVTRKWTGDDLSRERMKALKLWKMSAEYNTILGKKSRTLVGTRYVTTTDGLANVDNLNQVNLVGLTAMTEADLRLICTTAFRYASKKKLLAVAGVNFPSRLDSWGAGKLQTRPAEETYGVTINRYLTFFGELNIINHYLLSGDYYKGVCFLVDLSKFTYRPQPGRDLQLFTDIKKENNYDGTKDEWFGEYMVTVEEGAAHTRIFGIV